MQIAIHPAENSWSDGWIAACRRRDIGVKLVDCTAPDVIAQVAGCDGLMWHFNHEDRADQLAAIPLLSALSAAGVPVYPDPPTMWHFDDKIAQSYLFEALGAQAAKTWVFYNKDRAMQFLAAADFPVVFKLRRGAGSTNVQLIRDRRQGEELCKKAFGEGFSTSQGYFGEAGRKVRRIGSAEVPLQKVRRAPRSIKRNLQRARASEKERGDFMVQQFIEGADHDTRISVIGDRAFGFTRGVREDDFRASGSGIIHFEPARIDAQCVQAAFELSAQLGSQSMAYDFVRGRDGKQWVVEMCYGYLASAVHSCPGHWLRDGTWVDGHVWPQDVSLDDFVARIRARQSA